MKIIVGYDFTTSSENALNHATVWAKVFAADILLVNCFMPIVVDSNVSVGSMDALQMETIKELNEKLVLIAKDVKEKGVNTSFKVVVGDVKYALLESIKEDKGELLVLGKTNNPNFLERVIGSNSQHLLNSLSIPLLVIPENAKPIDLKVIAYATEKEFDEKDIKDDVKEIAQKFKSEIHTFKVNIASMYSIVDELKNKSKSIGKTEAIDSASFREGIDKFISKVDANLLVLTSHKRGLLDGLLVPSKSKMLIPKINIPVLIYHFT